METRPAVHAAHSAKAEEQSQPPIGGDAEARIEGRNGHVKKDSGHGVGEGSHERGPGYGMDGQAEHRNEERRDDGPPADAVDAAHQPHPDGTGADGGHGKGIEAPTERVGDAGEASLRHLDHGPGHSRRAAGGSGGGALPPEQIVEHLQTDAQKYQSHKELEGPDLRQPVDADEPSGHHPGHGPGDDDPREGPQKPPFPAIAEDAAGAGENVVKLIGGAHRGIGVAEKRHLEGQQQKAPGQAAHRRKKGDGEGHQRRHEGGNFDFGGGKIHVTTPLPGEGTHAIRRPTEAGPQRRCRPPADARRAASGRPRKGGRRI